LLRHAAKAADTLSVSLQTIATKNRVVKVHRSGAIRIYAAAGFSTLRFWRLLPIRFAGYATVNAEQRRSIEGYTTSRLVSRTDESSAEAMAFGYGPGRHRTLVSVVSVSYRMLALYRPHEVQRTLFEPCAWRRLSSSAKF